MAESGVASEASSSARFAALGEVLFCLIAANAVILLARVAGITPELFGVSSEPQIDARTGLVDGLFVLLKFAAMLLAVFSIAGTALSLRGSRSAGRNEQQV